MSFFRKPQPAPKPRSPQGPAIAVLYAAILVIMVVAQLFTFEAFLQLFASFGFPGGIGTGYVIAALLVTSEVLAIPFLLRMSLSPAFRVFSMLLAGLVADIWLVVTIWTALMTNPPENVGFFGTIIDIQAGMGPIFLAVALGILAIWATYELWPLAKTSKKKAPRKK